MKTKRLETDVLIIGGGTAGCFAAYTLGKEAEVGEVLLRFKGEFTRFSNPEDDMVIPMPGEPAGAMLGSKMNTGNAGSVPPPAPDFAPQTDNPFGAPGDGPLPF